MSKMGQELDRKLDENKYALYDAIQSAIVEIEDGSSNHAHLILCNAISKVEGKDG